MYKLSKIKGGSGISTDYVIGSIKEQPKKGECFFIFGAPRYQWSNLRVVNTSPVEEVTETENKDVVTFKTESGSVYLLEKLAVETDTNSFN
jgi:hypothetical protein